MGKKLARIVSDSERKRIQKLEAQTRQIQADTDLANELAQQAQNKAEKTGQGSATEQQNVQADNGVGSKGSILSRLRVAKAIVGTPNSEMGTGDSSLGAFFKKEFF